MTRSASGTVIQGATVPLLEGSVRGLVGTRSRRSGEMACMLVISSSRLKVKHTFSASAVC